jgi:hypothetical protein
VLVLPMRAGPMGLALAYSLNELANRHGDLNRALEEAWAGVLTVLREGWPDWPLEVWTALELLPPLEEEEGDEDATPRWVLHFRLFFAGEGPENGDVAAMVDFVVRGLQGVLEVTPLIDWMGVHPGWRPLWAVDDAQIYRLIAPEITAEPSVYLLGWYSGRPALFAASLEAWPLQGAAQPIDFAEADLGWAFV